MNLFDLYENREPYQQAIDKLEQRRIEDLEAKLDDCARRGDKEGFQKCKAERDSYHKIKETRDTTEKDPQGHATGFSHEGDWKKIPKNKAGRPVDPRGEVTHLSDRARREAERAAKADVAEGAGEFLYKKLRPSQYGGVDVVGFKQAPRNSVLSGQVLKHFIDSYETEEEARKAHPDAEGYSNKYTDPQVNLDHLPGEDDPVAGGMYPDDIDEQGMSEGADSSPVAGAIVNRIMRQRPDLLTQYGPKLISAAVDEVANYVGDVDEIGSSDVSGWVNQVERMLKENPPEAFAEAGIGQDLVTPQQRVQQSTPPKQTPVGKVVDTARQAAKWLAGRGGPGQEGPTYEEAELDEQQTDSNVNAVRLVWSQIIKAVADNVDFATITWPNGQTQKFTRNQLWHLDQKPRTMSRQAKNQWALKYLSNLDNLMYYLGNLKTGIKPRPQLKPTVDPAQPQLDLPKPLEERGQKKNSNDSQLDRPKDLAAQRALRIARQENPSASSDLEAFVKKELTTQEKTQQELAQLQDKDSKQDSDLIKVLALNKQQEQEITSLNTDISRLDGELNQALSALNVVPATPVSTPTTEPRPEKEPKVDKKQEPAYRPSYISAPGVGKTEPTAVKVAEPAKPTRTQPTQISAPGTSTRPALPPVGEPNTLPQLRSKYKGTAQQVPSVSAGSNDINMPSVATNEPELEILPAKQGKITKADSLKRSAQAAQQYNVSTGSGDDEFNILDVEPTKEPAMAESKMSELDAVRQDLELMTDQQFLRAYGMSKVAFQQKYRSLLKPAGQGYTNENVDNDDWEEDEGDYVDDPQAHAQVKNPLPDQVLRAIERNPGMRADIIAAYKRKQAINEVTDMMTEPLWKDLLGIMLIPATMFGFAAWYKVKDKIKLYRAEDAIRALDRKGIRVDRATFDLVRPMLQKFEQALAAKDAELAQDLADQIQKTVAWGKLKQSSTQADIVTPNKEKEQGMAEGSWGGSGPGGLLTPYAVYTKQNGQVKRIKSTNKIGQPMNPREAEAYVAAMRKRDPARWTHDTVWIAPADVELGEAANPAQQAAIAIAIKKAGKKPKGVAEESYTGVMQSQGITDPKLLEVACKIDAFAKTIK